MNRICIFSGSVQTMWRHCSSLMLSPCLEISRHTWIVQKETFNLQVSFLSLCVFCGLLTIEKNTPGKQIFTHSFPTPENRHPWAVSSLFLIFSLFSNSFSYHELAWHCGIRRRINTLMWWEINSILSTITIHRWKEHIKSTRNKNKVLLRKWHDEKRFLCYKEISNSVAMDAIPIIP